MSTTPVDPVPDDEPAGGGAAPGGAPGAEIGITEDGGGTFEPEEDPPTDD
jgi:hypothetical protein